MDLQVWCFFLHLLNLHEMGGKKLDFKTNFTWRCSRRNKNEIVEKKVKLSSRFKMMLEVKKNITSTFII